MSEVALTTSSESVDLNDSQSFDPPTPTTHSTESLSPPSPSRVEKVVVRLLSRSHKELKRARFQLIGGRLRISQLQAYFHVKNIVWAEEDVVLSARGDGLSDAEFKDGDVITILKEAQRDDQYAKSHAATTIRYQANEQVVNVTTSMSHSTDSGYSPPPTLSVAHSSFQNFSQFSPISLSSSGDSSPTSTESHSPRGGDRMSSAGMLSSIATQSFMKSFLSENKSGAGVERLELAFKVIVVGEVNSGKTSLIRRHVDGRFSRNYKATIGVDYSSKDFISSESLLVRLQLWDIAGQERFGNFTRVYYKDAVAGIVVFDISSPKSIHAAAKWKADIDDKVKHEDGSAIPVILVGNKTDLLDKNTTPFNAEMMDQFCTEHKFDAWFMTSCLENFNVDKSIQHLGNKILEQDRQFSSSKSLKLKLFLSQNAKPESKCCNT